VHGFPEELTSADEHGEQYQESKRVLAVQSVDEIVVKAEPEVTEVQYGFDKAVHHGTVLATTFNK